MPSRKLCVLFDIDGTLLITDVGRVTLREALREVSHVQDPFCEIRFGGRTDRSIVTELLERNRLPVTEEMFNAVRDSYLRLLPGAITQSDGVLLPGVQELLIRLQGDPRVVLFAMTGNFSAAAMVKLTYFGLQDYFEAVFGGDHDHRRNDLAKHTFGEKSDPCGIGPQLHPAERWMAVTFRSWMKRSRQNGLRFETRLSLIRLSSVTHPQILSAVRPLEFVASRFVLVDTPWMN